MYVCQQCHRRVRPATEPEVVFAVRRVAKVPEVATTATVEYGEWRGAFFHEQCFPEGSSQWKRRLMPIDIDDGDGES